MQLTTTPPLVGRHWLLLVAGAVWLAVGVMLVRLAGTWLAPRAIEEAMLLAGLGSAAALVIGIYGFGHLASRNIHRIGDLPLRCGVWAFQTGRSYVLVGFMMALGITLRHSALPKHWLAVLYIAIGGGLMIACLRYFGEFLTGRM